MWTNLSMFFQKCSFLHHSFTEVHHIRLCNWSCNEERKTNLIMLAAAFLSCVRSSGSCITSSRKPITRIFSSVFSSKSWGNTQEWPQCYYTGLIVLLQKQKKKKKEKKGVKVHLWVFGHPVTQHIQDSICSSSANNKLFVSVPLICRKTWNPG